MIKKPKIDMRTILYLLLFVLIVISVVYIIFNSSGDSDRILTVNNVLLNKESYLGDSIKVRGIYESVTADENYLKPSFTTDLDPSSEMLILNLDQIDVSIRENLSENNQYIVTGILSEVGEGTEILNVELIASEIDEV
jgi:hypothetical protein